MQGSGTEGNFCPSMGGRGCLREEGGAGGLEQGGWGLERAERLGSRGLDPGGTGRTFFGTFVRTDGRKFPPLFFRTLSPSGPLPKRERENE